VFFTEKRLQVSSSFTVSDITPERSHSTQKVHEQMAPTARFKTVMIGDSGVGKTTIVKWISEGIFISAHLPTIGSQFVTVEVSVEDQKICLELWDTAGQEVYRALVGFYARDARGAMFVIDSTREAGLDSAPDWLKFIREESPSAKVLIFVNKIDQEDARAIDSAAIEQFAQANGLEFVEGSAKTGHRLKEAFETLAQMMMLDLPQASDPKESLDMAAVQAESAGGCC
jgi:small GTP-binding protein